jgi:hypothetical protein
LVEAAGVPVGCAVAGANRNDFKLLRETIGSVPVERPGPAAIALQGLCLDKGYDFDKVRAFLIKYFGTDQDPRLDEPIHTATSKHRFGLVTVHDEEYVIADIGLRMLTPR